MRIKLPHCFHSLFHFKRILFCLLLMWIYPYSFAQTISSIDKMLENSVDLFNEIKFEEALSLLTQIDSLSKKAQYSHGITTTHIYKARIFLEQGKYDQVMESLERAIQEPEFSKDKYLQSEFYRIRGRVRDNLKMPKYALQDFYLQLKYAQQIENRNKRNLGVFYSYQNIAQIFDKSKLHDSTRYYLNKQIIYLDSLDGHLKPNNGVYVYANIALNYLETNEMDKAIESCKKAEEMAQTHKL